MTTKKKATAGRTVKAWAVWSPTRDVDEVKISEKDALWSRDWNNANSLRDATDWLCLPCTIRITIHVKPARKP